MLHFLGIFTRPWRQEPKNAESYWTRICTYCRWRHFYVPRCCNAGGIRISIYSQVGLVKKSAVVTDFSVTKTHIPILSIVLSYMDVLWKVQVEISIFQAFSLCGKSVLFRHVSRSLSSLLAVRSCVYLQTARSLYHYFCVRFLGIRYLKVTQAPFAARILLRIKKKETTETRISPPRPINKLHIHHTVMWANFLEFILPKILFLSVLTYLIIYPIFYN